MTEKQLERGQEILQEIKYLREIIHSWENLTEIKCIITEREYEEILSNLKNRLKELQEEFNNL